MMQAEDRFLSLGVLSFVIMVHLALIVGIRFLPAPELPLEPPGLSFVDLGLMDGGQSSGGETQPAAEAEPAPAPKPPPAQVKPQPQPQPRTAPRPEQPIKPVIRRDDRPADVAVRQEPLRNEPEAPATPTRPPATEPAQSDHPQRNSPAATEPTQPPGSSGSSRRNSPASGQGQGERRGNNPQRQQGEGDGGNSNSGGGEFVAPSHTGGYLNHPRPPYPPQLLEEGIGGQVRLQVMVEANGKPSSVQVLSASHPLFGRSAEKTVREQYTFRPATRGGQPVRHSYTFTIRFNAPR